MKPIQLSLRNRIAFSYMFLSGGLILIIFSIIYFVVFTTVNNHHKEDLESEASELFHSLVLLNDSFIIANPLEWSEKEHKQIEVNPTFMQLMDSSGIVVRKTGNLLDDSLTYDFKYNKRTSFSTFLNNARIKQLQEPLISPSGKVLGYLIIAVPLVESDIVLNNLFIILLLLFPISIIVLFISTKLIAGKSIAPVATIIRTAEKISKENLTERISLPFNHDELYRLTRTINDLLNRLEDALVREKQFTSDASHELRTPLAVIKGTLEVLIRKPRTQEQYHEKINYCINEVDRIAILIEQLLLLARIDAGKIIKRNEVVELAPTIEQILARLQNDILSKNINIEKAIADGCTITTDVSIFEIIIGNIISNAIKYSQWNGHLFIGATVTDTNVCIVISDNGIGMTDEALKRIFDRFYMAAESRSSDQKSVGLGLAIVKKLSEILNVKLTVKSTLNSGTTFSLYFSA